MACNKSTRVGSLGYMVNCTAHFAQRPPKSLKRSKFCRNFTRMTLKKFSQKKIAQNEHIPFFNEYEAILNFAVASVMIVF